MKLNGKNKNNSRPDSKELETDQLSKEAVRVVDDIPVKSFSPGETWKKISARLGQTDKRFVTWGLAMAASFSLLVAANLSTPEWSIFQTAPEVVPDLTQLKIEKEQKKEVMFASHRSIAPADFLAISPVVPEVNRTKPVVAVEKEPQQSTVVTANKSNTKKLDFRPLSNPFISVFAKANFQQEGFAPEIGLDFKLGESYTAKRRNIYKLGLSSQFDRVSNETGESKLRAHTFVNLEFTSLKKETNKGWTARSGYLLNPDGQLFQDTTIKVSLFRNISKHLKIGPEVIFTDNLRKAYPAVSLILG